MSGERRLRRGRVLGALAALCGAVLVLAGCASIPTSSAVKAGAAITQETNTLDLDFNPSPPAKGASQEDLLHGFIDAASSPKKGYAIAREYLTPRLASRWDPDQSTIVDLGVGRDYAQTTDTTWQLSVMPRALVDADGNYSQVTSPAPVTFDYQFVKVSGQWRISVAPNGIILDSSTFTAVFGPQTLYFFSPNFSYLVPDQRWFPSRASTATRIAKALLAGPSKWLDGAVVSAFPPGTELTVDAVTTSGNVAQLDLSAQANQANTLEMQRMKLQLTDSLSQLVTSVQLSIEGTPQTINNLPPGQAPSTSQPVDSHPLVYRASEFGFLAGSTVEQIPGISDKVVALHPVAATLNADRTDAAVLAAAGVYSIRSSLSAPTLVDNRPDLIAPAIDNYGYTWSVPSNQPSELRVTGTDNQPRAIKTNWSTATQIASLAVSRDGTRLIALVRTGEQWSLVAAGIVRSSADLPESVGTPLQLSLNSKNPVQAAWVDELNVVTLGQAAGGATTVDQQQIGGIPTTSAGPTGGVSIAGVGGIANYLVLTSTGSLQAPTGAGWQVQAEKIGAIGVQMGVP
jgi:Lipoprotein LpqB beta-propeller domain/Sporulation and spore germination